MSDNTIEVPRQTSFYTPTGDYHATVRSISRKMRQSASSSNLVRLVFNVHVPNSNIDYLAKLDVPENMHEGSDLWNIICRLLSRQELVDASGGTFDLNRLVGLPCEIHLEHVHADDNQYDFPLVIVTEVREKGRLVKGPADAVKPV